MEKLDNSSLERRGSNYDFLLRRPSAILETQFEVIYNLHLSCCLCMPMHVLYVSSSLNFVCRFIFLQDSILFVGAATTPLELRLAVANGLQCALPSTVYWILLYISVSSILTCLSVKCFACFPFSFTCTCSCTVLIPAS